MPPTLTRSHSPLDQVLRRRTGGLSEAIANMPAADQAEIHRMLREPVEFVDDEEFHLDDAEQRVFEHCPDVPEPNTSWYHPVMEAASSARTAKGVVNVVLDAQQERALFLQFNYARFRLHSLLEKLGDQPLSEAEARELLIWHRRSGELRDRIARFNLALVLAMAKRVRSTDLDFADLISEGNMALLRAVDKFNVSRGFKFSTYACRAILKAFSRIGVKQTQYRNMFPTDFDPALEKSDQSRRKFDTHEDDCASEVRRIVQQNKAELTDVEQKIIHHRFALDEEQKKSGHALTLEQVGKLVGLTKERVRQIQNKALDKIRRSLEENYIDGPHHRPRPRIVIRRSRSRR